MIKLFIVDHHVTERLGMRQLIKSASDIRLVGEADTTIEALERLPGLEVDVVLADFRMDEMNGVIFTRKLKKKKPGMAVLIVTSEDDLDRNVEMARQAGAKGFLSKDLIAEELTQAIRQAAGEAPFFAKR